MRTMLVLNLTVSPVGKPHWVVLQVAFCRSTKDLAFRAGKA
jgi:hypothetical protein